MREYKSLSDPKQIKELGDEEIFIEPKEIKQDCIKCGYDAAAFAYVGSKVMQFDSLGESNGYKILDEDGKQYMLLECGRCGYRWVETPLDDEVQINNDDPGRHNISGSMNRPAGCFRSPIEKR